MTAEKIHGLGRVPEAVDSGVRNGLYNGGYQRFQRQTFVVNGDNPHSLCSFRNMDDGGSPLTGGTSYVQRASAQDVQAAADGGYAHMGMSVSGDDIGVKARAVVRYAHLVVLGQLLGGNGHASAGRQNAYAVVHGVSTSGSMVSGGSRKSLTLMS